MLKKTTLIFSHMATIQRFNFGVVETNVFEHLRLLLDTCHMPDMHRRCIHSYLQSQNLEKLDASVEVADPLKMDCITLIRMIAYPIPSFLGKAVFNVDGNECVFSLTRSIGKPPVGLVETYVGTTEPSLFKKEEVVKDDNGTGAYCGA